MRVTLLALAVSATVGCGGESAEGAAGGGEGGGAGMVMPAMGVEVVVARQDTVTDAIEATGQIEAFQSIDLRPDVEGRLVAILAREGSVVGRGTPLFRIDDAELRAQVARAEADRDLARQTLARTRQLIDLQGATASELERAEATLRSTQATLDLLALRLSRTTVRAPFGGQLGRRLVSLGDYVTTTTRLISLQTYDPQRAAFAVPERYAERLAVGQRVRFRVAALPKREFVGVVDFVDPAVQLPGRTITARARVANPRRELQTGMFVEASLATAVRTNAVVIPEDAVLQLQGENVVWVAKDGKADRRVVNVGVRTPGFIEVLNGVAAGEQVVVAGAERLGPGVPVNPTVVQRGG